MMLIIYYESARTCNTDTNSSDNNNITTISDVVDGIKIEKSALVRNNNNICVYVNVSQWVKSASMTVDRSERERERAR